MKHSADMAAVANKKSAMSGEDITQFAKYAMGLTTEPTSRLRPRSRTHRRSSDIYLLTGWLAGAAGCF
jgi:hypothetical protein